MDKEAVPRNGLFFAQFIRTDLVEDLLRLGGSETELRIGVVAFAQLREGNSVLVPSTLGLSVLDGLVHLVGLWSSFLFFTHLKKIGRAHV